jgi:tetratricopeptide (TPR) repeat protein
VTTARALVALVCGATLAAGTSIAAAQSRRYPKPPVDPEAEADARSDFWEEIVRPGAGRYEQLIGLAAEILRQSTAATSRTTTHRAIDHLEEAVALRGDLVDGWGYLGVATRLAREWEACADAYGRAHALDPGWKATRLATRSRAAFRRGPSVEPLELGWGTCLARAGDLQGATDALEALVARGEDTGESWLRLGEVYMASGRLAEAITAFHSARNQNVGSRRARWLLAVAYDRARRPGDADDVATGAGDVTTETREGAEPFVPPSDLWYVRAYGLRHAPEKALALFRTYLVMAPGDSPWRARAQEHIDALETIDLATRIELEGSGDRATIEKAVRAALPALRRCVDGAPTILMELRITQNGPPGKARPTPPRATPTVRVAPSRPPRTTHPTRAPVVGRRPPARPPARVVTRARAPEAPGVRASALIFELETRDAARDAAECLEKVGLGLSLPRPATGAYSTVRIPVVAER